jgi:hypothetical protein
MDPTMIQHLARARLADLHRQARRETLVRSARRTRRAQRQHTGHHRSGLAAVIARRARLRRIRIPAV